MARKRQTVTPEPESAAGGSGRLLDEVVALMSLMAALFTLLSFVSFQVGAVSDNLAGRVGYELADTSLQAFGLAAYGFPVALALLAVLSFRQETDRLSVPRALCVCLLITDAAVLCALAWPASPVTAAGGWLGGFIGLQAGQAFGRPGALLVAGTVFLLGLMFVTRTSLSEVAAYLAKLVRGGVETLRTRMPRPALPRIERTTTRKRPPRRPPRNRRKAPEQDPDGPMIVLVEEADDSPRRKGRERKPVQEELPFPGADSYQLPSTGVLDLPRSRGRRVDDEDLRKSSRILEGKLADFGIQARVVAVRPGPVITTFDIEPAPGVKVNRIVSLGDDLSMALRVPGVRILAPVPGKAVVGIEVANPEREEVRLREILESDAAAASTSPLTLAMGKDTAGTPVVADLARMPHLLIAGATGSGKSVSLNSMIMSILFKARPADVRFVLIDMKMLELSVYEDIPHLLVPVVTDPHKVVVILKNIVDQMEERYQLMKRRAVRGIDGYNRSITRDERDGDAGIIELTQLADAAPDETGDSSDPQAPQRLPKIVVIIDELADLMMTVGRKVEEPITRLAQKARAAGIHLILATQRPSVDVITGLIKANFPARVSFQTTSRVDSRTILDQIGAERLLGGGDMLYMPAGTARIQRLHGPLVTETEILRVVNGIKKQGRPQYALDLLEGHDEESSGSDNGPDLSDELYDQAVRLVAESRQASISWVQRRLRVGYNRAARMIERMEREGVVSVSEGGRPREVLVNQMEDDG